MKRLGVAAGVVLASIACAGGCATLAPLAVQLGADLISTAAQNYSKRYSNQIEGLLLAMYSEQVAKGTQGSPAPQTQSASPSGSAASAMVLDAAILVQRASERAAGRTDPVPIRDGERLRDGGSDPRKGDVVKFSFRANCKCYVYVIGVDPTGYVARVFPDQASRQTNPVRANQQYVVPQGTAWYGLDQYKGVEQVFFISSRKARRDIESALKQLAQTPRSSVSGSARPVREAVTPSPAMRGLVKVQMGTQSAVQAESGRQVSFTPEAFAAQAGVDDIVVTRWFSHE